MDRKNQLRASVATAALALLIAAPLHGAILTAVPVSDTIMPGGSTLVMITLELSPGEVASVFEGHFDMSGHGSVGIADLTPGGPSWPAGSSFGSITGDRAVVSLTSSNDSGNRLVATIEVTGLGVGVFDIVYNGLSFAAFDIASPPFLQDLPISNAPGSVLASITVVPVPAALALLAPALGLLLGFRRGH